MSTRTTQEQRDFLDRVLLPSPDEILLLRACLCSNQAGIDAFNMWSAKEPETGSDTPGTSGHQRRMLPLLQAALERNGQVAPDHLRPVLRAAGLYEDLRSQAYREIARNVFHALSVAHVPFLAVGGVVAASTLYAGPERRHCHDIDLLVPVAALEEATVVLKQQGFKLSEIPVGGDRLLLHESGLPLLLHTRALPGKALVLDSWDDLYASRLIQTVCAAQCETLSHEYALLQVLLKGPLSATRDSLLWASDAFRAIAHGDVRWEVLSAAIAGPAELLLVFRTLRFLQQELDCAVPEPVLASLQQRWDATSSYNRSTAIEVLLLLLVQQHAASKGWIWSKTRTPRERLAAVRGLLFPSADALMRVGHIASPRQRKRYCVRESFSTLRSSLRR